MENIREHQEQKNADQEWYERITRDRGEDIYGEGYYGDDYRDPRKPPFPVPRAGEREWQGPLSGFRYGDRGSEDITQYGRVNEYNRGRVDSYRYPEDQRRNDEATGDWWAEDRPSRMGYTSNQERSQREGLHRGKGPKNYKRSDERVREDINERLSDDAFINASDIEVNVTNGEVTLTGKVDSRTSKRRAEDISESVSGVKNVENRLRVAKSTETSTAVDAARSDITLE